MKVSKFAFFIGFLGITNLHADGPVEEGVEEDCRSALRPIYCEGQTKARQEDLIASDNETRAEAQIDVTDKRTHHLGEEIANHAGFLHGGRPENGSPGASLRVLSERYSAIPISFPSVSLETPWWERWWQSIFVWDFGEDS